MMIEPADIRRLLDAFEQSDWQEIRLSVAGTEVLISASDNATALPAFTSPEGAPLPDAGPKTTPVPEPQPGPEPETRQDIPPGEAVRAPSPGIFWHAPAPGAPPFVGVGQHVEAESVVCIVEVMKLMNRVVAGVSGTVAAILVENSQQVAKDQQMIIITPDGGDA